MANGICPICQTHCDDSRLYAHIEGKHGLNTWGRDGKCICGREPDGAYQYTCRGKQELVGEHLFLILAGMGRE